MFDFVIFLKKKDPKEESKHVVLKYKFQFSNLCHMDLKTKDLNWLLAFCMTVLPQANSLGAKKPSTFSGYPFHFSNASFKLYFTLYV